VGHAQGAHKGGGMVGHGHNAIGGDGGAGGEWVVARRDRDAACGSGTTRAVACADGDGRTHDKSGTAGCDRVVTDRDGAAGVIVHADCRAPWRGKWW
jgi:hypothetical protein